MSTPLPEPGLARRVVTEASGRGLTLGTAESLTGGLLSAALTAVPGASAVLVGGVVAYDIRLKSTLLDVPAQLLESDGAVSERTARAMAVGVCRLLGVPWGLATTGVAGPDPSEGKPPGTVHVAVHGVGAGGEEVQAHRVFSLHGTRDEVRAATVQRALELLIDTWGAGSPVVCQDIGVP